MTQPIGCGDARLGRRAFLQGGSLLLVGAGVSVFSDLQPLVMAGDDAKPELRVGLVTDLHYAVKDAAGDRHYRESLAKFADAARQFEAGRADLVVALGDSMDTAPTLDAEKGYLREVKRAFSRLPCKHHFVVGNHCVSRLNKPEFLEIVGQPQTYFSFDAGGRHFIVLDACFRSDGTPYERGNFDWTDAFIPPAELDWLQEDLKKTPLPAVICVHQCLDVAPPIGVKNAAEVRKVFEASGKVHVVLQGHWHEGHYQEIAGIHYCTLKAMVVGSGLENNAFAMLDFLPGGALRLQGFKVQNSFAWS